MTLPISYAGSLCCVSLTAMLLLLISARAQKYILIGPVHCRWTPQCALFCCHAPCCSMDPVSFCVVYSEFLSESNATVWLRIKTDISHDSFCFISVSTIFKELLSSVERTPVNVAVSLNEYKHIATSKFVVKWWPAPQGTEGLQDHWKHIVSPPTYFLQANILHGVVLSDLASKIWLVLKVISLGSSGCQKPIF